MTKEQKLNDLWTGNWTNDSIDLTRAICTFSAEELRAIAHGCGKNKNIDVLYILSYLVNSRFQNPGAEEIKNRQELEIEIEFLGSYPDFSKLSDEELIDYLNERIKTKCIEIIKEIIYSAVSMKIYVKAGEILSTYAQSENEQIRLYMACATPEPETYLTDSNERISKVAAIRSEFKNRFLKLPDDERKQIEFLDSALKTKVISIYDGLTCQANDDKMSARFASILFSTSEYVPFDLDVCYNIRDEKLLAYVLNQTIAEGTIAFEDKYRPSFFPKDIDHQKLIKK